MTQSSESDNPLLKHAISVLTKEGFSYNSFYEFWVLPSFTIDRYRNNKECAVQLSLCPVTNAVGTRVASYGELAVSPTYTSTIRTVEHNVKTCTALARFTAEH